MAVKASTSITLSAVVDVASCTRYYLLQSSTLSPPVKPTVKPPAGSWNDTEPTYTSGSTNSLFFCDLTVFSDGTWSYSSVSRSSSYEAAKEAYNKAQAAQTAAGNAQSSATAANTNVGILRNEVNSKGVQLVTNGSGLLGNNTNFSAWTYDPATANNGSNGSFKRNTGYAIPALDEYISVTGGVDYLFEFDAKTQNGLSTLYAMLMFFDADKREITATTIMFRPNTLTSLAQELKRGDTVVHLTDLTNWDVATQTRTYQRGFIFWNYTNSFGYTYPQNTYSRNAYTNLYTDANVNKTAKTITLNSAWTGANIPVGTKVSQSDSGSTYKYLGIVGTVVPGTWTHYTGVMKGEIDTSGQNVSNKIPPGAAYCKIGFLWNYNSANDTTWITNVSLKQDYRTSINNAQTTANTAQSTANAAQSAANTAQSTANSAQSAANTAQSTANAAQTAAGNAQTTANSAQTSANNAQNTAEAAAETAQSNRREIDRLDGNVSGLSTQFNVFTSGIEATIEDHSEILSAMSFSTEGLKVQMAGSIYYTLTDDVGYHIYQNNKEIAAFSEGKGSMEQLQMGNIICRKTSKGGWVWSEVNS